MAVLDQPDKILIPFSEPVNTSAVVFNRIHVLRPASRPNSSWEPRHASPHKCSAIAAPPPPPQRTAPASACTDPPPAPSAHAQAGQRRSAGTRAATSSHSPRLGGPFEVYRPAICVNELASVKHRGGVAVGRFAPFGGRGCKGFARVREGACSRRQVPPSLGVGMWMIQIPGSCGMNSPVSVFRVLGIWLFTRSRGLSGCGWLFMVSGRGFG